jgi:hypothetical protein
MRKDTPQEDLLPAGLDGIDHSGHRDRLVLSTFVPHFAPLRRGFFFRALILGSHSLSRYLEPRDQCSFFGHFA